MTPQTIDFLTWLVSRQVIEVGSPDARTMAARAFTALDELAQLAATD
ncbi:MAG: hypothetical protein M0Z51_16815 [Propionibacterium sp.]|nr:hypothetical protein [Propionibacterium sp.]